ncbi:serine/threonine-protein kinase [Nonomuraea sp. NPDC050663]|uniref:serine/threonine-protein kinase n=1 Tax=Nonomuraea sp. NPDC050663 TaxID=3364370 RepID=UPI00378C754D
MDRHVAKRYRLIEPLGEGGMGIVWRAHDELLDRVVAVKEVRYAGVGDRRREELNRRTVREARAAGRLDHPAIVVVHDVVEEDGRPWIVMQLVPSRSLAAAVKRHGPLPVPHVARIGLAVLSALRAAHAGGVLHRDVKPENVLLADDGRVVLTDFGIASSESDPAMTGTGHLVGTPAYMPPERLNGLPATPASDLWSLGATLYTAAEGRAPFGGDSWAAAVAAVLRDRPEPPRLAGPLAPAIMGLLHADPAARMSAAQAEAILHAAQAQHSTAVSFAGAGGGALPGQAVTPVPSTLHGAPRRRSPVLWIVPAAAIVVAAAAGGGWWWLSGTGTGTATGPTTSPTPTTSPSTTPTPSTSATPSPDPAALPRGWRRVASEAGGFSIGLPKGWTAAKHQTRASVNFSGPGAQGQLTVEWTEHEKDYSDESAHWRDLESQIMERGEFKAYRRIAIRDLTYQGVPAADWEFVRERGGVQIHVINRGFRTADGRPFALYWEAPQYSWAADLKYFTAFARTFRPS